VAENIFAKSPFDTQLDSERRAMSARGYLPDPVAAAPRGQQDFEDLARKSRVPVNILMAIDGEGPNPETARRLADRMKAGSSIEDAVASEFGDTAPDVLAKAKKIGADLYGRKAPPADGFADAPASAAPTDNGMSKGRSAAESFGRGSPWLAKCRKASWPSDRAPRGSSMSVKIRSKRRLRTSSRKGARALLPSS
jgi:hypothetical protein